MVIRCRCRAARGKNSGQIHRPGPLPRSEIIYVVVIFKSIGKILYGACQRSGFDGLVLIKGLVSVVGFDACIFFCFLLVDSSHNAETTGSMQPTQNIKCEIHSRAYGMDTFLHRNPHRMLSTAPAPCVSQLVGGGG